MRSHARLLIAACLVAAILAIAGCGAKKAAQAPPKATHSAKKTEPAKAAASKTKTKEPSSSDSAASPAAPDATSIGGLGQPANPLSDLGAAGSSAPAPAMAKAPVIPPAPMKNPAQKPTAEQLLAVLQGVYGNLPTLRASGSTTISVKADGKPMGKPQTATMSVLFKRPGKFVLVTSEGRLISDGKTVYNYIPAAKQYAKTKMDGRVLMALARSKIGVGVLGLLFGVNYKPAIASCKALNDSKVDGKDAYVLSIRLKSGVACPKSVDATQTLWIGKSDFGLYKNVLVMKYRPQAPKGAKGKVPRLVETVTTSTLSAYEPNPKLADSKFAFSPPAGVKPYEAPKPVDMSGKPAADFSFTRTDGVAKKISDLKGKVVVLDFWALPMCAEHLPALQSIYDANKDSVEFVAINLNTNKPKVEEFVKKKGYTFPYVHADEQIAKAAAGYKVMGLPTMFIIDGNGVIQEELLGVPTAKQIQAKLDKVRKS